jgi:hypothetical protein
MSFRRTTDAAEVANQSCGRFSVIISDSVWLHTGGRKNLCSRKPIEQCGGQALETELNDDPVRVKRNTVPRSSPNTGRTGAPARDYSEHAGAGGNPGGKTGKTGS